MLPGSRPRPLPPGHDVCDAARDDHDAVHGGVADIAGHVRISGQDLDDLLLAGVRGNLDPEPGPAVDLHREHDRWLAGERRARLGEHPVAYPPPLANPPPA